MGLPGVGLNPRKLHFEGRDALIRECDSLWGVRIGHNGYHFMDKGPKELQERILSLWPVVYQKEWPKTKEIGLSFAIGVMAERKGTLVNWALFAAVVRVSGFKAHKRPHSDFVTIMSPTSHSTIHKKGKGLASVTSPEVNILCEGGAGAPDADQGCVTGAPMQETNPSFVCEDHVGNQKKESLGKRVELLMRLVADRDAFVIGLRAELKLVQNNLSQVGYQTLQCKERLEVARNQQTTCGPEADADFHIFCALEVKHALDELVSLVGQGDTLQRNIDSIQERLDSELNTKKNILHDYHATLAQYYAADQLMMSKVATAQIPKEAPKSSEVLNPAATNSGKILTLAQLH